MHTRLTCLVVTVGAASVLALATSAGARRFALNNQRFVVAWSSLELEEAGSVRQIQRRR
jgi:hypothetical protein